MKISNLKGALLEFIVRNLLRKCGFTNVEADDIYTFEKSGLFFVNGKGAAHDADVIMNPPIQIPFHYPTQIIFECKAYKDKARLPIIRSALGLRNDLNDFEIVTRESLSERKNNRRRSYAVETRNRFLYQIGIATINDFSKPAIEFGTNNRIPLLSLSWFFNQEQIDSINNLSQEIINRYEVEVIRNVYDYFKDRNGNLGDVKYALARQFLRRDNELYSIITHSNDIINNMYVGLLETGDMLFLFTRSEDNILRRISGNKDLVAEIHWYGERPNIWILSVSDADTEQSTEFEFYLPNRLLDYWNQFNFDRNVALNIKQEFFSRIFVFNRTSNRQLPVSIIKIDRQWLQRARERLNE